MSDLHRPHWIAAIVRRMLILWPLKALGTSAFMVLFFWLYFITLNRSSVLAHVVPLTWLDRQIPFLPSAYWIYISLWLYVSLPPALLCSFRQLIYYGLWVATVCAIGLLIFWVYPTQTPRFAIDWDDFPMLATIKGLDGTGNAMPSLHVATAVFSCMWLNMLLRQVCAPLWFKSLNILQCMAIIGSTLAIRQHVALDALAGVLLGGMMGMLSLHWQRHSTRKTAQPQPHLLPAQRVDFER